MKSAFTILLAVVLFIQKGIAATSGTTSGPLATLAATCDNQMKVYFDGALQEQDSAMPNWPQTSTLNIPDGTKVVAIECLDVGVVGGILASTSDGRVTDGSWQCSKTKLDGWTMPGFTDNSGAFVSADQSRGSHGVAPWGIRPGIAADANWIWHSPTHSNPDSAYCRMELAGNPVEKCCAAKTVGDIAYSLVEEGQVPGRCLNGCIYKRDSDPAGGQKFCFASGPLPVECITTGGCPATWTALDTGCYLYQAERRNWTEAKAACEQKNGYLVEITSKEEQDALVKELYKGDAVWIGLTDADKEGSFIWEYSGNVLSGGYSNWRPGEPNGLGQENCVLMYWSAALWNDNPCHAKFNYICEL